MRYFRLRKEIKRLNSDLFNSMLETEDFIEQRDKWRTIAEDLFVMLSAYVATKDSHAMQAFVKAISDYE